MPICVMVIPQENFQVWRTYGGHIVQSFNKVREAAEQLDERDNKGRVSYIPKEAETYIPEVEPYYSPELDDMVYPINTNFTPLEITPTGSDYCQKK